MQHARRRSTTALLVRASCAAASPFRGLDDLDDVDFISSNVSSSHQEALLYVFEDNEAVIKMIKGKKYDNETCFQNPQSCA